MDQQTKARCVLPKSKKIKKKAYSSPLPKQNHCSEKKYNTFNMEDKKRILTCFKKDLIKLKEGSKEVDELSPSDLLKMLDEIHITDFNTVLTNSLYNHIPTFKADVLTLRIWRRRIKEWIRSIDTPETRGQLRISQEKLPLFKKYLIPELKQMPSRNLIILRQKLPRLFQKIDHPVGDCSRHWWYSFMDKHADVKSIWESLPRRLNTLGFNKQSNSDSEEFEEMELHIKAETFSPEEKQEEGDNAIKDEYFEPPQEAKLEGAKLEGAKFEGAKVEGVKLEGVKFEGAKREESEETMVKMEEDSPTNKENKSPSSLEILMNLQAFQYKLFMNELLRNRELKTSPN